MNVDDRIQVRTAPWRMERLQEASELLERSISDIVREAIDEKLDRLMLRTPSGRRTQPALIAHVSVPLTGDEVQRFAAYKEREIISMDTDAARKLLLERLAQVEGSYLRKPMARSGRQDREQAKALIRETLQEWIDAATA